MARRRKPRGNSAPRAPAERPVPPTPETVAKLRHDILERLARQGRLRPEHLQAATEIRRVWEAFGRGLFPRAHRQDTPRQNHRMSLIADPVERLSAAEEIAWRYRYRPWAREMSVQIATGAIRVSRLQIVLDVVVDNYGLRQVEGWYRMRHGVAMEHLRQALHRYCEISRWIDDEISL